MRIGRFSCCADFQLFEDTWPGVAVAMGALGKLPLENQLPVLGVALVTSVLHTGKKMLEGVELLSWQKLDELNTFNGKDGHVDETPGDA